MHEGDKWEVYIPAKWGYGAMKMDDIPADCVAVGNPCKVVKK